MTNSPPSPNKTRCPSRHQTKPNQTKPNQTKKALQGKDITIYGDGAQTRSFQYVADLVNGLIALMNSDYDLPVNLGNPDEYTVKVRARPLICLGGLLWLGWVGLGDLVGLVWLGGWVGWVVGLVIRPRGGGGGVSQTHTQHTHTQPTI
jgi:hypothetical protein